MDVNNLVEVTNDIQFVYVTIPKEYIVVYHNILLMLADYGIDMLKDCKASCTDRNSGVIECFNMFNAAIAAYKLNNISLANTLIVYVKAKIEQIYKGKLDDTPFVFPLDENNEIKSLVISENDNVKFYINPSDNELFANTFVSDGAVQQQFIIDTKDEVKPFSYNVEYRLSEHLVNGVADENNYEITLDVSHIRDNEGNEINLNDCIATWTLDGHSYNELSNVVIPKRTGYRNLNFVLYYANKGVITTFTVLYEIN